MNAVCIYLISRMEQFLEGRQRIRYRRLRFLFFTGCQATEEQDDYSPKQSTTFHRQSLHQRQYTNFLSLKWFDSIHQMIRICLNENPVTPWDSVLLAHYQEKDEFFWLNDSLISDKPAVQVADSMLFWLGNISQHGVNPNLYPKSISSVRNCNRYEP